MNCFKPTILAVIAAAFISASATPANAGVSMEDGLLTARLPKSQGWVHLWLQSSLERIYPKTKAGTTVTYTLEAARNQRVSFQIGMENPTTYVVNAEARTTASSDMKVQIRRVGYVPMQHMTPGTRLAELEGEEYLPGLVPDPLYPETTATLGPWETQAFWVTVDIPADTKPGLHELPIDLVFGKSTTATLTAKLNVHEFTINKRKDFPVTHWWRPSCIWNAHNVKPWGDEWFTITKRYLQDMVEHGSNCILVPSLEVRREVFRVPNQMLTITKEGDRYAFDWELTRKFVHMAKDAGMEYFEWPHLWIYWGVKNPMVVYKQSGDKFELYFPINSDGFGPEYLNFLKQYLDSLHGFLQEEGLLEKSFFHLSDEPGGGDHYERYKKARGILKDFAPWMKVMDALSHLDYGKNGVTDIPVPSITTAKSFKEAGIHHWAYFCCGPTGDYLNRFMDTPLAKIRMSGMVMYRLGAEGFLHWGYNYWDFLEKDQPLNVYERGDAGSWPGIPYGDPFVVYPGTDGPNDSIRWEVFAESLQDFAMLQTAGISPDDPILKPIVDYNQFPKSESWILETIEKVLESKKPQ